MSKVRMIPDNGRTNASLFVTAGEVIFHDSGGVGDFFAFDARTGQ